MAESLVAHHGLASALTEPAVDPDGLDRLVDAGPGVVALAEPGALADPSVVARLRHRARVIWLDGSDELLAERSGLEARQVAELRRRWLGPLTVGADWIVTDPGPSPIHDRGRDDPVVSAVLEAIATEPPRRREEWVELADGRRYPVVVGRGVVGELAQCLPERARRVAVVTQAEIGLEVDSGREQQVFIVPDGEGAKRLDEAGRLASAFAQWGMTRADCVVSVGGGVASDLAGFVAATYHRGIPVVHVSTTLLGQIDAAIGGKCGVNLPEGKNLVGAFWQPHAVLCDVDTLATLPAREFRSGMGELAKYHFLGGGQLDRLELVDRVARSAAIKAEVVSGDEREGGRRAILNYGHTLAHVLETLAGYQGLRHGEAVAVGLIYAAELAHVLGRIDRARVDEHRRVVAAYGLDVSMPAGLDHDEVIDLFARDKKAIDGVTFVLDGPNGVEPVQIDDRQVLATALAALDQGV